MPDSQKQRIVFIGWGSLTWNPGVLACGAEWFADGPSLPLEFARQSKDGRVTLVLSLDAPWIPALWSEARVDSVAAAAEALGTREGTVSKFIGICKRTTTHGNDRILEAIVAWLARKHYDAAVFTNLPPKWNGASRSPTEREVVSYLSSLTGEGRSRAEEYVRRAPRQVITPYRTAIEARLDWTPTPGSTRGN